MVPQDAESFRTLRNVAERAENHTLTVREVAKMFEAAGVARTERSIVNWCQLNRQGMARLDSYFDANERKYFITPESVNVAIQEELARAEKGGEVGRTERQIPNASESLKAEDAAAADRMAVDSLRAEIMDLQITNKAKDYFIKELKAQVDGFSVERREYVDKLMSFNRRVGELEASMLQLKAPINVAGLHSEGNAAEIRKDAQGPEVA